MGARAVSGYEVEIGQLRAAAKAAGSAADQARAVEPGTGLGSIATALPGGEAAKGAPTLASTCTERAKGWAGEIDRWSESITKAAKAYSENENSAEEAFGG
ncbi:hypothetical protein [Amycolatopsis sp. CB00013]|uniref:hypothetical protein n=1 Tax=Amycolatopsis sp. CB00013 TaxID=1703945 RepID=UPI001F51839B|nr:hypothetical protein [Amycolatopsis sp. CB00013]